MQLRLCVVIPAFNEEIAIAGTIAEYRATFPHARIVVVDNNSSDATAQLARGALGPDDHLIHERRQGKGAAVKSAASRISADIYIMTDGDGTYPAREASRLLDILLHRRCDMVVGDRVSGGDYEKQNHRRGHTAGNAVITKYVSLLAGEKYSDVLSGLRVMSRPFVGMLDFRSAGFQLETELNIMAAYVRGDVIESPVEYLARPVGSASKLSTVRDGLRIVLFALLNWVGFFPMMAFGIIAGFCFLASSILGLFVVRVFLESGKMPYPTTAVVAAALGLIGIQALFSGLVLRIVGRGQRREQIARFLEARREWNTRLDRAAFSSIANADRSNFGAVRT